MVQQITKGIKISVKNGFEGVIMKNYVPHFSFFYVITIQNQGKESIQFLSRHWQVSDALNKTEYIDGEGIVGKKPIVAPGSTYVYRSSVLLFSTFGEMRGHYNVISHNSTEKFKVYIPSFNLCTPFALN